MIENGMTVGAQAEYERQRFGADQLPAPGNPLHPLFAGILAAHAAVPRAADPPAELLTVASIVQAARIWGGLTAVAQADNRWGRADQAKADLERIIRAFARQCIALREVSE